MAAVIILSDFRAQEEEICHCFYLFPSICQEVMRSGAMILDFLILSIKPAFFHSRPSPSSRGSLVPLHFLPLE